MSASYLAFADELLDEPLLLDLYAAEAHRDPSSRLVVYAPGADPTALTGPLETILAGAGLEREDVVLLAVAASDEAERQLAAASRALLSARRLAGPLAELPRLGPRPFAAGHVEPLVEHLAAAYGTAIPCLAGVDPEPRLAELRDALDEAPAGVVAVASERLRASELSQLLAGGGVAVDFCGYGGDATVAIARGNGVPAPGPAPAGFRVVAVVSAYNEADVLEGTVRDLVAQGVEPYLVDNWSTDGTWELAQRLLAGGLLHGAERFPASGPSAAYEWARILTRVAELGASLGADWVIHHDADERRRAPWPGVGLRDALHTVERRGFDAVDHTVAVFHPVDDSFRPELDLERALVHFEFGRRPGHFVQIKAWQAGRGPVELARSGGHEAEFAGRKVFPFKFLLKHYPVRSQRHGEQKVFRDRRARWSPAERARGWHHQYDAVQAGHRFLRRPEELEQAVSGQFEERFLLERLTGVGIPRER